MNFSPVARNVLYKGGTIDKAEEFNYVIWQKGVRTILSFLDPEKDKEKEFLKKELKLIGSHNQKYPDHKITFDVLPLWSSTLRTETSKIKKMLIERIKSLPKPVYMHCLAGEHCAKDMAELFREAAREGKINLKI